MCVDELRCQFKSIFSASSAVLLFMLTGCICFSSASRSLQFAWARRCEIYHLFELRNSVWSKRLFTGIHDKSFHTRAPHNPHNTSTMWRKIDHITLKPFPSPITVRLQDGFVSLAFVGHWGASTGSADSASAGVLQSGPRDWVNIHRSCLIEYPWFSC